MHTDREESGEEIEMQENIEEWPFSIYQYFLNFAPLKSDIIMLICNGNSYLLGGK
jgi:hypothetical protein